MANETINTAYVGKDAGKYISKAVLNAKTISGGYISPQLDVDGDVFIHQLDLTGDILQEYNETFTARGGYAYTDRVLSPKTLMVNLEFSKTKLLKSFENAKMKGTMLGKDIPADFLTYVQDVINGRVNELVEKNIWEGDYDAANGTLQKFDGIIPQLQAAGSVKISGTTAFSAFTSTNIVTALAATYDALGAEITETEDFKLYVSENDAKKYRRYLGIDNVYQNQATVGKKEMDFEGVEVVATAGISGSGTIVGAKVSNLYFGTNIMSDINQMVIKDMFESNLDDTIRIKMVFTACTNFGYPSEIVLYKR